MKKSKSSVPRMNERSVGVSAQKVARVLDTEGKPLLLHQWTELLQMVMSECRVRLDAAREDALREGGALSAPASTPELWEDGTPTAVDYDNGGAP